MRDFRSDLVETSVIVTKSYYHYYYYNNYYYLLIIIIYSLLFPQRELFLFLINTTQRLCSC